MHHLVSKYFDWYHEDTGIIISDQLESIKDMFLSNSIDEIKNTVKKNRNILYKYYDGKSMIYYAVQSENKLLVQYLLENNVNFGADSEELARQLKRYDIFKMLHKYRIDLATMYATELCKDKDHNYMRIQKYMCNPSRTIVLLLMDVDHGHHDNTYLAYIDIINKKLIKEVWDETIALNFDNFKWLNDQTIQYPDYWYCDGKTETPCREEWDDNSFQEASEECVWCTDNFGKTHKSKYTHIKTLYTFDLYGDTKKDLHPETIYDKEYTTYINLQDKEDEREIESKQDFLKNTAIGKILLKYNCKWDLPYICDDITEQKYEYRNIGDSEYDTDSVSYYNNYLYFYQIQIYDDIIYIYITPRSSQKINLNDVNLLEYYLKQRINETKQKKQRKEELNKTDIVKIITKHNGEYIIAKNDTQAICSIENIMIDYSFFNSYIIFKNVSWNCWNNNKSLQMTVDGRVVQRRKFEELLLAKLRHEENKEKNKPKKVYNNQYLYDMQHYDYDLDKKNAMSFVNAVNDQQFDVVEKLLSENKLYLKASWVDYKTPQQIAMENNDGKMIKLLLKYSDDYSKKQINRELLCYQKYNIIEYLDNFSNC